MVGCEEHPYSAKIDGKIPPTFTVKTNESVYFFRVLKPPVSEDQIRPSEAGIWQIEVDKKAKSKVRHEIKYGVVPDGYIQKIPKNGIAPPALIEGQEYIFFAPTPANIRTILFKVENGRTVIID